MFSFPFQGSVETLSKKASLKIKKKQYRNQKKAAANEVSAEREREREKRMAALIYGAELGNGERRVR